MEDKLKEIVVLALEAKLGRDVEVTHREWESAKRDTMNDIYCNRLCNFQEPTLGYFINTMVNVLAMTKRAAA